MCINPSFVWVERDRKQFEKVGKPCGDCWRCRSNRLHDIVGRSLCEAAYSQHVAVVTLTYAPRDDLADKVLHPRHFQLFMKRLRNAGHKVRYLVAGEYGEAKGRAHFHVALFFKDLKALPEGETVPAYGVPGIFCREIPSMEMVHLVEWPHGHVLVDWTGDERAMRYVAKYFLKAEKGQRWLSLSKKPALGAEFFAEKARRVREAGLAPGGFSYLPPGADGRREYLMTGATRRDYLLACDLHHTRYSQLSEWVQKSLDKVERKRRDDWLEQMAIAAYLDARAKGVDSEQKAESLAKSKWIPRAVWDIIGQEADERERLRYEKEFADEVAILVGDAIAAARADAEKQRVRGQASPD